MNRTFAFLIPTLFAVATALPAAAAAPKSQPEDPNLWLEDVTGQKSLDWVKAENAITTNELAQSDAFKKMQERFLEILDSDARIPTVEKIGPYYYNFWRDKLNTRAACGAAPRSRNIARHSRRGRPCSISTRSARRRSENWVWQGASALPPEYTTLPGVALARRRRRGGGARVRPHDADRSSKDGFVLPEAKSDRVVDRSRPRLRRHRLRPSAR